MNLHTYMTTNTYCHIPNIPYEWLMYINYYQCELGKPGKLVSVLLTKVTLDGTVAPFNLII